MKNFLSIFQLIIIVFYSLFLSLILFLQQLLVHQKNWSNDNISSYKEITISIEEFEKYRINKKEIKLNGKMYDILSYKIDDKVFLKVIEDKEETIILNLLIDFIKHYLKFINIFELMYTLNISHIHEELNVLFHKLKNIYSVITYHILNAKLTSIVIDKLSPPPRF